MPLLTLTSSYFVPGGVSGPMVEGAELTWTFPDVSCVQAMKVVRLEKNKEVELDWFKDDGSKTHVLIKFEKLGDNETMVSIKHSDISRMIRGYKTPTPTVKDGALCSLP